MRVLRFLIIQIILVVILALLLEGMGQLYFLLKHGYSFKESLMYVKDNELIYRLNPKYKGKDLIYNGFRGEPFSKHKPKGFFRIVAMGASTTWGSNTSYRNSWPLELNLLLNQKKTDNIKYEVINAGVSGYGSAQHYVRLKNEILDLSPDMIIIFSGWNLVGGLDNDVYYWVPDNIAKPNSGFVERIAAFLTNNSVIFAKLRAKFPEYLDAFDLSIGEQKKLETEFGKLAEKHKRYLKKMIRLIRDNNIIPVLIKYPQVYRAGLDEEEAAMLKTSFPELYEHRKYLNRQYEMVIGKIEEAAKEENAFLIDCSDCFGDLAYEEKIKFFADRMHLSDTGFPIEARAIYNALIKNAEFQSKKEGIKRSKIKYTPR